MSREKVNDALFQMKMWAILHEDSRSAELAVSDVAWYIHTYRAGEDFLEAIGNLTKRRARTLVEKITPHWDCTDKVIAASKKYLKIKDN